MTASPASPLTASELYIHLGLPKNLQRHMQRVAAVGEWVVQHSSEPVPVDDVIKTLLLHDLGNVIKFDLSAGVSLLDPDERDEAHWQRVQQEMIATYGDDVHVATLKMAQRVSPSPRVVQLLNCMGSSSLRAAVENEDWARKICCYSDFRVDPHGFVTLRDRFDDIIDRYTSRQVRPTPLSKILEYRDWGLRLEQQLQSRSQVPLEKLPAQQLEQRAQELAQYALV